MKSLTKINVLETKRFGELAVFLNIRDDVIVLRSFLTEIAGIVGFTGALPSSRLLLLSLNMWQTDFRFRRARK